MARYIELDALVTEIERLKTIYDDNENIRYVAKYNILVDILSFLDTLEVKEVDLTNAFIEKACDWLRNYINPIARTYLFDGDIEKFRKTMKGE